MNDTLPQITLNPDHISIEIGCIRLRVYRHFYTEIAYRKDEQWNSMSAPFRESENTPPLFSLIVGDVAVDRFALIKKQVAVEEIKGIWGEGVHIRLAGEDNLSLRYPVRLELSFEVYDRFQTVIVTRCKFDAAPALKKAELQGIVANHVLLDATRVGAASPYSMWVYNGSAETREHCLQELTRAYYKRNYLGVPESYDGGGYQPDYRFGTQPGFGGGIPVTNVWCKKLGVAVGHLEPQFALCSLPVTVIPEDGRVSLQIVQHTRGQFGAGKTVSSLTGMIILHEGDFYNALTTYREMLALRGALFPPHPDEAYEPQWDTWGFRDDYTKEDILSALPHLKEIGIRWITLDDRWYDATGDWQPRKELFPGGEEEFCAFIDRLHQEGFRVKLWTLPGEVDADVDLKAWLRKHPSAATEIKKHPHHVKAKFYEAHPGGVVCKPNGEPELSKRGNCYLCGTLPEVIDHFRSITEKMFKVWKIDGLKQDAVYICPACFDKNHSHTSPDEASIGYGKILRVIYETATKVNPHAVIMNCPCGTPMTPDWMQWQNQAISPDPWTSWVNRGMLKQMKALFGARAAVVLDHIEISDEGKDFSLIGAGGVPATRITPSGKEKTYETGTKLSFPEKKQIWKYWITLYNKLMLSKGEYLNLYDFIFDVPETHVIRQNGKMYYAFYPGEPDGIVADERRLYLKKRHTKIYNGAVEFRGLSEKKRYRVYDYEQARVLGIIHGKEPFLDVQINHHLLVELSEIE
ncbi:MAG: alpha-galactosidase [bacterium]